MAKMHTTNLYRNQLQLQTFHGHNNVEALILTTRYKQIVIIELRK